jgi:hypothetical protein
MQVVIVEDSTAFKRADGRRRLLLLRRLVVMVLWKFPVENSVNTYLESLQIKKALLPAEHISTAMTEHCIGLALLQIGKLDKALGYFQSSLKSRRSLLGSDHLDVSFSLHK